MINCPYCGKSHYKEIGTYSTCMYFPPEFKDDVNVNPDRNTHTTECECLECHKRFNVIRCGEDVKVEKNERVNNFLEENKTEPARTWTDLDITKLYKPDKPSLTIDLSSDITIRIDNKEYKINKDKLIRFVTSLTEEG